MSEKESNENIKQRMNQVELILSSLDTGLSVINSDYTISWVNEKIHKMFPGADPIGQICHRFYESSDGPCEPCPTFQCFKSGRVEEVERFNPNSNRWYRIISQPIKDPNGQVVNVLEGVTDITERKEEEKAIQQERSFLKKLLEVSPVGISVLNKEGQISQANAFAEKTLGLRRPDIYNRRYNDPAWRIMDFEGNSYPEEKLPFQIVKRTGKPVYGIEHAIEWSDGRRVLLSINATPLFDNNGTFNGMISVIEDVTGYKQAEDALKESETKYRLIAENIADIITTMDMDLNFTYISPSILKLRGFTVEEAMEQKIDQIMTPESFQRLSKVFAEELSLAQTGSADPDRAVIIELEEYKKDGSTIWVENTASFIRDSDQKPLGILAVSRDITDRKQAEAALKKQNYYLEKAQELGQIGTWELDLINNILIWTDENCRIFGVPEGSIVNYETFFSKIHPEDREYVDQEWKAGVEGKFYDIEHRLLLDGEVKWVREKADFELDDNGKAIRAIGFTQDITERKQAGVALTHSHELMRYIIEHNRSAIAVHDRNLNYVYVSQRYLDDYKVKEKDVIGKHHYDVFPDLPQKWRDVHQKALVGELSSAEDDPYIREDGTVDWTRWECRPWYESDGSIGGIIIYTEVITERKQVEEKLRDSETRFRILTEQSPNMVFINQRGKVVYVNDRCLEMMGYSKDEFCSHDFNFLSLIAPESLKQAESSFKKHMENIEISPCEYTVIKKDGSMIETMINTKLIDYQGERAILGIVTDITEQKRIEKELRKSQERYYLSTKGGNVGVWDWNLNTGDMFISPNLKAMLGYDDSEIQNHIEDWGKHIYAQDVEAVMKQANACIDGEVEEYRVEHRMVHKDGGIRWFLASGRVERGKDGQAIRFLGTDTDITKLKVLEETLRQAQKMESIGTLTGGIAHDFNNIMGIILGNTELALDDVPEWNPAHTNLEEIQTASLRAANIVRQLLSFTRITDQKLQPIEIAIVVKDSLTFLRSSIPTTIDIEQDIKITDEIILADPTQINQIIMNLCINASHAMEETGGTLKLIVEKVVLDDNLVKTYPGLNPGEHIKIMVSDTGPGIDPKIINRIFDPYFTTKEVGKGSGMGLSVVHGIVKNHNGTIDVENNPGKGTRFNILFPLAAEKPMAETETSEELPRGSETILFVDDEISIVKMAQRMFQHLGYKVETATTPQDALDRFLLNSDHFDLVITDMTMPQMTGVKLSEKLMEIRTDIPIIICTGHSALVDEEKAKELGLAAYVMKPINMREISQTIRKVLDRK